MKTNRVNGRLAGLCVLGGLLTACALGQQLPPEVVQVEGPSAAIVLPPGMESPPLMELRAWLLSGLPETEGDMEEESPEQQRLRGLLQVSLDRGSPAVLMAMAAGWEGAGTTNEIEQFRAKVVAGDWAALGQFLQQLPDDHARQVYRHLLQQLSEASQAGRPPNRRGQQQWPDPIANNHHPNQQGPGLLGSPALVVGDILTLAAIAPEPLTDDDVRLLGQLLARLLARGDALNPFLQQLEKGAHGLGGTDPAARSRAAGLLLAADRLTEAVRFLVPIGDAKTAQDWETLEQHAIELWERGRRDQRSELLRQAWDINQFLLAAKGPDPAQRESALRRSLDLMPLLSDEVGADWLRQSFRSDPSRGLAILGAVNEIAQSGLAHPDVGVRAGNLQLQKRAVELCLSVTDAGQSHWRVAINLLAQTWMQEAAWSEQRYQPPGAYGNPMFDQFGNVVGYDSYPPHMMHDGQQMPAIEPEKVVLAAPANTWLDGLDESLRWAVLKRVAQLQLKTDDPGKALPVIETLASFHSQDAGALVDALVRAWAAARNPSSQHQRFSHHGVFPGGGVHYYPGHPYGMSGFGIPLTRAKQVRNIEELAEMLRRLKALQLEEPTDDAMVNAFTMAHSPAEVFRLTDVERVFGPLHQIESGILAGLGNAMRQRLAEQWRSTRLQQQAKTGRTDKEIEDEVLGGYASVQALIAEGLRRAPGDWRLNLTLAAVLFDLAEFQYGQKVDLETYVEKREEAFRRFEEAAALYAAALPGIPEKEQGPVVQQQWFNANLGASDLAYVTRQQEPETSQLSRIRASLQSLPGSAGERHLAAFARDLGQQAGSLQPQLKSRYLRAGLVVVGDHPEAEAARKLVAYYDELTREVELAVRLDGDALVGHGRPFGVFVSLLHTAEIEREAGGFARYLVNANRSSAGYYHPYPDQQQRNFIEDFEQQVREKLVDQIEVLSVTFLDEKTQSRGGGRSGWRETPLAYLLLQAKDGAVDQLPPFQMDLDFTDPAGPVVLPVRSAATLLDARPEHGVARPVHSVEVTQILDDRELADGRLTLEVKATGMGLVPELSTILTTHFAGFTVDEMDDLGVVVNRVETEAEELAAVTERNWLVKLETSSQEPTLRFQFPSPAREDVTATYKRYADADLVEVEPQLALTGLVLRPRPWWHWPAFALPLAVALGLGVWRWRRPKSGHSLARPAYALPARATPFTLIGLLRTLSNDASLSWSASQRKDLLHTIGMLESHFFARERNGDPEPDLQAIGQRWLNLAGSRK